MLLDEPTEGLDATTESQILDLLAEVMKEKTVLMVTHRLRGLARFNQIIIMDNGKIIEQGSHAELLAQQGRTTSLSSACRSVVIGPSPQGIPNDFVYILYEFQVRAYCADA
ncbi:Lipid A export ATP-binding/permease protein MsbA [Raoultella terrigena]|uniref:Lipid A export ATP-binding/permease protein MsbA n=1 Tax=Raoultella terrigena TaxID=577 RepID=A0A4U9DGT5_RAOTE|nr:Lipid A export ATP-binding/permease protein MsbA [Raoultella terrigena]